MTRKHTKAELLRIVESLLSDLNAARAELDKLRADIRKPTTEGRIEAFEFAATQFEVYASDNDALHARYGTKSKLELARAEKRSQTFRDCAAELRAYAAEQRKDLEA
jgi:virulence-associated protein VapD